MKISVFPFVAIALCGAFLAAQNEFTPVTEFVRTEGGFVRGKTNGSVDQFLGIPYAVAPTGDLRWKPPAPPPRWNGIRDATQSGSECVQLVNARLGNPSAAGSEDCLFLNIYRPVDAKPRQLLPVLIFIHGGSNQKESGSDYDPSEMVAKTGIIAVTINYRLNVFGFLALPALDAETGNPSSGNFGLLDQQAAMQWVRANILAFGADPLNVTIDGESSGGIDVCASLVSPRAAGLFNRAILESMYCPADSHNEALTVSNPVAAKLGCTNVQTAADCMRAKAPADVLQAAGPLSGVPGGGVGFNASPNFGNNILPLQPTEALRTGHWNWSPILLGSNHDEAALMVAPALIAHKVKLPLSVQAYQFIVERRFGTFAPAVLSEYPPDHYRSPFFAYADLATDKSLLGCPVSRLSHLFSTPRETFQYEFDDPEAPIPDRARNMPAGLSLGAYHGSELQYLFKMTHFQGPRPSRNNSSPTR
jgi:para-nitrobenzyl esterase